MEQLCRQELFSKINKSAGWIFQKKNKIISRIIGQTHQSTYLTMTYLTVHKQKSIKLNTKGVGKFFEQGHVFGLKNFFLSSVQILQKSYTTNCCPSLKKQLNQNIKALDDANQYLWAILKFIYSEKAAKFCKIFTLLLTGATQDISKVEILCPSQNI